MTKLILFTILLFPAISFCQITGIPQLDSLIELRDDLRLRNTVGKYTKAGHEPELYIDALAWLEFQIECWEGGRWEKRCIFQTAGGDEFIYDCNTRGGVELPDRDHFANIRDTMIYFPRHISAVDFENWKLIRVLKRN